jgi:hypothetical protein
MPTYSNVLVTIFHEVTGRPCPDVQVLIDGIAAGLGTQSKLQDTMTDAEAEKWLTQLRQEKAGI